MDELDKLTENKIIDCVKEYLVNKPDGNWHVEMIKEKRGRQHGPDMVLTGGSRNGERFVIECKGRSNAKSANSINKEGWLNALGQLITRMNTARTIKTGETKGAVNRAYKYGLGLYWVGAQVALRRIPHEVAKTLNLYIFSVYDDGYVKQWSPKDFEKEHPANAFKRQEE